MPYSTDQFPRPLDQWPVVEIATGLAAVISEWRTPLTDKVPARSRRARLRKTTYTPGVYPMERVGGLEYWMTENRLSITGLEIAGRDWKLWMVDDPVHWYGMRERVMAMPGGMILCAGLGLGLMLWHFVERQDIEAIYVVEQHSDVIELMQPLIPQDERIAVLHGNYYDLIKEWREPKPDAVLWDLAVGGKADTLGDMVTARVLTKHWFPDVPLFRFGIKSVEADVD